MFRLPVFFLIFLLMPISYIGYLCSYSNSLFLLFVVLLVCYAISYILYFGVVSKPEMSIYAYLCLICFYTKKHTPLDSLLAEVIPSGAESISLFFILEAVAISAIIVALLGRKKNLAPREFKTIYVLLGIACALSIILVFVFPVPYFIVHPIRRLQDTVSIIEALIFLTGCAAFIKTQRQVDKILLIFLFSGLALFAEVIIFKYWGLFSSFDYWIFHKSGRFRSLAFMDILKVGIHSVLAIACALYFALSRRKYAYLLLIPMFFLVMIESYERIHMLMFVLVLCVFFVMALSFKRKQIFVVIGAIVIAITLCFFTVNTLIISSGEFLQGKVRSGYFSNTGFLSRIGAWTQGLNSAIYVFPFGTGPESEEYVMSSKFVPEYISARSMSEVAWKYYQAIRQGRLKSCHNFYLCTAIEYGLIGILALGAYVFIVIRNFNSFRRRHRGDYKKARNHAYLAQVYCYSMLLALGVYYMFQPIPKYFFLLFLLLYLTSLLPKLESSAYASAQKKWLACKSSKV